MKLLGKIILGVCLFLLALPALLAVLVYVVLLIAFSTDSGDYEKQRMQAILSEMGMAEVSIAAPYDLLLMDDALTAGTLFQYDNRVDNTDLWSLFMATAQTAEGWHVAPVSPAEFAEALPEGAAFLLPAGDFDAWYAKDGVRAWFDADTGLFVHLDGDTLRTHHSTVFGVNVYDAATWAMDTHGGFHGDGDAFRALIVPQGQRAGLVSAMGKNDSWHESPITQAEYVAMTAHFYSPPDLYPAADVVFDWWVWSDDYYKQYGEPWAWTRPCDFPQAMENAGACHTGNWSVALYDEETGLLIYYEYDS